MRQRSHQNDDRRWGDQLWTSLESSFCWILRKIVQKVPQRRKKGTKRDEKVWQWVQIQYRSVGRRRVKLGRSRRGKHWARRGNRRESVVPRKDRKRNQRFVRNDENRQSIKQRVGKGGQSKWKEKWGVTWMLAAEIRAKRVRKKYGWDEGEK